MSILEAILELIGEVPVGYEPLAWVAAFIILVYLLCSTFSVIVALLNWIAGRR